MSLRARTLAIIAAAFILLGLSVYVLFSKILVQQFMNLEEVALKDDLVRVRAAVENSFDQLVASTTDWAQWDATYDFLKTKNEEYISTNYTYETLSAVSVDRIVFFDLEKKPFRELHVDENQQTLIDINTDFSDEIIKLSKFLPEADASLSSKGMIHGPKNILMFAAIPIVDSKRSQSVNGFLLRTFKVNQTFFETLARQTSLDMQAEVILNAKPNSKTSNTYTIEKLSTEFLKGTGYFLDVSNIPVIKFSVKKPRLIFKQGIHTRNVLLGLLLIAGILTLGGAFAIINLWILRRFISLGQQLNQIKLVEQFNGRVDAKSSDEIGSLAVLINEVLASLQIAQGQAVSANQAKSRFISRVSHEMRTPISGIIGINRIIRKQQGLAYGVEKLVEMVDSTAQGLLTILDEILDFSKIESDEIRFEKIPFNLRQLLRETMQTMAGRLEGKYTLEDKERVQLICEVDSKISLELVGDPTRLRQILINLLGNAIKFTQNGYIELKIEAAKDTSSEVILKFTIRDSGIGMPKEQLGTIFEPFKQADETISRKYQGTGLGLSIVKQFTEGLGGTIAVESELDQGTVFTVLLPFSKVDNDYFLQTESYRKRMPKSAIIIAENSMVTSSLIKNLSQFGITPNYIDPYFKKEISEIDQSAVINSELLIISELALQSLTVSTLIEKRLDKKIGFTIALLKPSSIKLAEDLDAKNIQQILFTPVLADDLILSYLRELPQLGWNDKPNDQALNFNRKLKVLVVDDVATNRLILEDMLSDVGHQVTSACDGIEMIQLLTPMVKGSPNADHFDIVLTDISMPIMDGDVATRQIRELEKQSGTGAHTLIIAITAHALKEEQQKIQNAGVDGILVKPIDPVMVAAEFVRLLSLDISPNSQNSGSTASNKTGDTQCQV